MYFQIVIFVFAIWGLFIYKESGSRQNRNLMRKKYVTMLMILFSLQSGLRNLAIGADTYAYALMFRSDISEEWNYLFSNFWTIKDAGYHIMTKAFGCIINDYRIFLISIACFFFSALGNLLYRYLKSNHEIFVATALYQCLYYQFFSITGLRQTIATGFILFLIPYFFEKKFFNVAVLFICAMAMHKTALIFFMFLILSLIKNSKLVLIFSFIIIFPMFSAGTLFSGMIQGTIMEEYAHYLEQSSTSGALMFTIYILLLGISLFFKVSAVNKYSDVNYVFVNAIACSIMLSPLLSLDPNNQRIVQYFSIFGLLVLPQLCYVYEKGNSMKICYIVFAILALYTMSRRLEYKFYWQDMEFVTKSGISILNDSVLK